MKKHKPEILYGEMAHDVLAEKIVNRLLTLIKEKHLKPGDRLPPERELAKMMKVGRPSLREALRALQMMNIIAKRQGSGNYITSLEPERLVEHLDIAFALDDSTYSDLFQARRIMESAIAGMAAQAITDEELGRMEESLEHAAAVVGDPGAFLEADMELHELILKAARNRILSVFMRIINKLGMLSRRRTGENPDVRRQTVRDHRLIVEALRRRDSRKAQEAMTAHLTNVERMMKKNAARKRSRTVPGNTADGIADLSNP